MPMTDFRKGLRVVYVPSHVGGDFTHPDCEHGVVKRQQGDTVFVLYDNLVMRMTTGDEPYTAQGTRVRDLIERPPMLNNYNRPSK